MTPRMCPKCGYRLADLEPAPVDESCPACGLVISRFGRPRGTRPGQAAASVGGSKRLSWSYVACWVAFPATAITCAYQIVYSTLFCVCGKCGFLLSARHWVALTGCAFLALTPIAGVRFRRVVPIPAAIGLLLLWGGFYVLGLWGYYRAIVGGNDYFDIVLVIPALLLVSSTALIVILGRDERRHERA